MPRRFGGGELKQFTLDERLVDGPVNAVVVGGAARWSRRWPPGDPSIRAIVTGDSLAFCTEALASGDVDEIGAALSEVRPN